MHSLFMGYALFRSVSNTIVEYHSHISSVACGLLKCKLVVNKLEIRNKQLYNATMAITCNVYIEK